MSDPFVVDLLYMIHLCAADLTCLRFGAAFGTICLGETHGTCEDEKIGGDAEAAAREGGDEAAYAEGQMETREDSQGEVLK